MKNPIKPLNINNYSDELDSIDDNGEITISEDLGLGVIYDYNYAKKFLLDALIID